MGCQHGGFFITPKLGEIPPTNGAWAPALITDLDTLNLSKFLGVTLITSAAQALHEVRAINPPLGAIPMNPRLLTGLILAVASGGAASAAPFIGEFVAHDDMHAGALWRNDRPNNNNQRGAGFEHQTMVQLAGGYILVFGTASYTDVTPLIPGAGLSSQAAGVLPPADGDPGVQAQGNRVEGLCVSYKLDATQGLVKNNMAYITDNDSPDWQNMHRPAVAAVNQGAAAMVLYGYDPNGTNTSTYGKVIGPNCEILSKQTKLFANTNDNHGGINAVRRPFRDVAGKTPAGGGVTRR